MADIVDVKMEGVDEVLKKFDTYSEDKQRGIDNALWNVAGKILFQAKNNCRSLFDYAHKRNADNPKGRLMGSLTMASTWGKRKRPDPPAMSGDEIGDPGRSETVRSVVVGTNVVYARRIEFGFYGPDKLGRVYAQAPKSYLYPAFFSFENDLIPKLQQVFGPVDGPGVPDEGGGD